MPDGSRVAYRYLILGKNEYTLSRCMHILAGSEHTSAAGVCTVKGLIGDWRVFVRSEKFIGGKRIFTDIFSPYLKLKHNNVLI
jgi:hypothetical protein